MHWTLFLFCRVSLSPLLLLFFLHRLRVLIYIASKWSTIIVGCFYYFMHVVTAIINIILHQTRACCIRSVQQKIRPEKQSFIGAYCIIIVVGRHIDNFGCTHIPGNCCRLSGMVCIFANWHDKNRYYSGWHRKHIHCSRQDRCRMHDDARNAELLISYSWQTAATSHRGPNKIVWKNVILGDTQQFH